MVIRCDLALNASDSQNVISRLKICHMRVLLHVIVAALKKKKKRHKWSFQMLCCSVMCKTKDTYSSLTVFIAWKLFLKTCFGRIFSTSGLPGALWSVCVCTCGGVAPQCVRHRRLTHFKSLSLSLCLVRRFCHLCFSRTVFNSSANMMEWCHHARLLKPRDGPAVPSDQTGKQRVPCVSVKHCEVSINWPLPKDVAH